MQPEAPYVMPEDSTREPYNFYRYQSLHGSNSHMAYEITPVQRDEYLELCELLRPELSSAFPPSAPIKNNNILLSPVQFYPKNSDDDEEMPPPLNTPNSSPGSLTKSPPQLTFPVVHINDLPVDIIQSILSYITGISNLLDFMCVQKSWLHIGAPKLWAKPILCHPIRFLQFSEVLKQQEIYPVFVQKLSLNYVAPAVSLERIIPLFKCKGIQRLSLQNCKLLTDGDVAQLVSNLPYLESLDVMSTDVGDLTFKALADHTELQSLVVGCKLVTNEGLFALAQKRGRYIKRIRMADCPLITPQGVVSAVVMCQKLVELNLVDLVCFSEHPSSLSAVVSLNNMGFTNKQLLEILTGCSQLKELVLNNCSLLTSSMFKMWSSGLTIKRLDQLRALSLVGGTQITDSTVVQLITAAPRLKQLNLSKCPLITDKSLFVIASEYRSQLTYLHLGHCTNITDKGVISVVQRCPRLSFFDAGNCVQLTDQSLIALAALSKLRRVGLVRCPKIGHQGVLALATPHTGVPTRPLERLHLSYCPGVSVLSIRAVLNCCHKLVHLSLTGNNSFLMPEVLALRRTPPEDFNAHQKEMFCVFSGSSISKLRGVLNNLVDERLGPLQT